MESDIYTGEPTVNLRRRNNLSKYRLDFVVHMMGEGQIQFLDLALGGPHVIITQRIIIIKGIGISIKYNETPMRSTGYV